MSALPRIALTAVCPTCNRRLAAPKLADKKLTQDLARAERSIAILNDYVKTNRYNLGAACALEAQRLYRALADHKLLWSIYRRRDKASGYGISLVAA
jgi:hypothetical protein